MADLSDLDINQLLAHFLDQCRVGTGKVAIATLDALRLRICDNDCRVLPYDPREYDEIRARAELAWQCAEIREVTEFRMRAEIERLRAENKRLLATSAALAMCRDVLEEVKGVMPASIDDQVYEAFDAAEAALK